MVRHGTCGSRRGVTLMEVMTFAAIIAIGVSVALPGLRRARNLAGVTTSLSNLQALHKAYSGYAAEWNDRQPTFIVDNFSTYGTSGSAAVNGYANQTGSAHPPLILGQCENSTWGYYLPPDPGGSAGNYQVLMPTGFATKFGAFRIQNAKPLHDYVDGRFFSKTFYPPNDRVVYNVVSPWFDGPCEYDAYASPASATPAMWSSYCSSPAAMFDPQVLRAPSAGGYRSPYSFPTGFTSPSVSQAQYSNLKTRMLEHNWNQNAPDNLCNTVFNPGTYAGCEPYYFNMAHASAPATTFFDGSIRLLPNDEAFDSDAAVLQQTGGVDGLWHRGTPMGINGYYGQYSYDGLILSHHILTTNGILGRDTLGPAQK